jgi:site-specific DNA recombinase
MDNFSEKKPVNYAVYVRLSKQDDGRAASLEQQTNACRTYVEGQGGTVILEARDVQSGLDANRPGYLQVLEAARAGRIDAAVVWRFDRWGRDTLEALRSFQELLQLGIEVRSATESSDDPFLRDLLLLLANRESRVISSRVRPIMEMQARDGRWQTRPPTGYDLADGRLVPNETAPLIRSLFERAAKGQSIKSLRRWAQSMGLRASRSGIHKILKNPAYAGDVVYNRVSWGKFEKRGARPESEWIVTRDAHPAIIDRETFERVQAILDSHTRFRAGVNGSRWLLTGIARCGYCGGRLYARVRTRSSHMYYCYRRMDYGDCEQPFSINGPALDTYVIESIRGLADQDDIRGEAARMLREEVERETAAREAERANLKRAYEQHQTQRTKLTLKYADDAIPRDAYQRAMQELTTAIDALEAQMAKLEAPPAMPDLELVFQVLEKLSWGDLEAEDVAVLVERVEVFGRGDYRIHWTEAGRILSQTEGRHETSDDARTASH